MEVRHFECICGERLLVTLSGTALVYFKTCPKCGSTHKITLGETFSDAKLTGRDRTANAPNAASGSEHDALSRDTAHTPARDMERA